MRIRALYVHIPFCISRCDYCDFISSVYTPAAAESYLKALNKELRMRATGLCPQTVYIGGGTPTSLNCLQFTRLFDDITRSIDLEYLGEFTVEVNPGTLDLEKVKVLKAAGVNRISLGVQSFNGKALRLLGRKHDSGMVEQTICMLKNAGFANISIDLIYAWPGQTEQEWRLDISRALLLGVDHLSCYTLSIEPGTCLAERLADGRFKKIDQDRARSLFDMTIDLLTKYGLQHYEISNFAVPGKECTHNLNYWTGGEYLAIGAAAHSHINGERFSNSCNITTYINKINTDNSPVDFSEKLPQLAKARECAVIWLRLIKGINQKEFFKRTGIELIELYTKVLPRMLEQGWLRWSDDQCYLSLTKKTLPIADCILADLV